ncbi:cation diffusion facilitator family transporter [Limobrevibacterium gyesilva]|uniref:Protein p34 n=1 Tax=Limobrevibacterium gyesilva TaxID=2991712 RepID=A0AA41YMW1_9PROT|nr:cation diffusion facilitator family transporter [Limobrevibacterium gyesilva]
MKQAQRIAAGSIVVGLVVLGLKMAAWAITGSAALFSDAAESVVNVAAGIVALLALRLAAVPADANHPYGHDKAEFFSAVIEGVLIVVAAIAILQHAWHAYTNPQPIEAPLLGMALNAVSTVLNLAWAMVLIRRGRRLRSPALVADGHHLMSDVVTSAGVLIGVGLVVVTGLQWLDPLLAAMTAVYILASGALVIRDSVGGLMDAAPAAEIVERIRTLVGQHAEGAIEAHDLRTRHAGRLTFLEFHLVVPGAMSVSDAHAICDRIEAALKAEMEGLMITIHVEPEGKAKHRGILVL